MSISPEPSRPDEQILLTFQMEFEARPDPAVLERYCGAYPDLAGELRLRAELILRLLKRSPASPRPTAAPAPDPAHLGCFRVLRRLGGNLARLYLASDDCLGRPVAVKVIDAEQSSAEARRRFARERRVLALLRHHTNIVPIYAAGQEGPLQYFAMPYVDGAALHYAVRAAASLPAAKSPMPALAELAGMAADASERPTAPREDAGPAEEGPAVPPGPPRPPVLSREYFVSVARAVADVAEALDHAHRLGIVHRDVKPGNLMVDRSGQCHVIDFGLAGFFGERAAEAAKAADGDEGGSPVTAAGMPGTPPYMAPEQWARVVGEEDGWTAAQVAQVERWRQAEVGAAADVWGLGVTLYELLTLQRAFPGASWAQVRAAVFFQAPPRPSQRVRGVPADLEAICARAMHKEPGQRYATAAALAADLRHWLKGEPTSANPPRAARRVGMWARRNPGWAAALGMTLVALVLASAGSVIYAENKAAKAQLAAWEVEEQARAALFAAKTASHQAQVERREALRQLLQFTRMMSPHEAGWRAAALFKVRQSPGEPWDEDFRDHVASLHIGLDAWVDWHIPGTPPHYLAFDAAGQRVVAAGAGGTQVVRVATSEVLASRKMGTGPVAFRDGEPVQLVLPEKGVGSLVLRAVTEEREIGRLSLPEAARADPKTAVLSTDGAFAAAMLAPAAQPGAAGSRLAVWRTATGQRVGEDRPVTATVVALAADGSLVAAGDGGGTVRVWAPGKPGELVVFRGDGRAVSALAFGRDPWRRAETAEGTGAGWLLADGQDGGSITVWEVARAEVRSRCLGSDFNIAHLAFAPDGQLLASHAHNQTSLWDVATGQRLLRIGDGQATGLAYSPAGDRLLIGQHGAVPDRLASVEMEPGQGARLLYGLRTPVGRVRFSRDGQVVAAQSHDWQAAVWDVPSGRLRGVFDVPPGGSGDNCALALDEDGGRLAVAAGRGARLWDTRTGKVLRQWPLPEGIVDKMVFAGPERLLLFRAEREPAPPPEANGPPKPWACRLRNLLGAEALKPLASRTDFAGRILNAEITPDGRTFLVVGQVDDQGSDVRLHAYDAATGQVRWSVPHEANPNSASLWIDPTGQFVGHEDPGGPNALLNDATTGAAGRIVPNVLVLGPGAELWAITRGNRGEIVQISCWDGRAQASRTQFRLHTQPLFGEARFDRTGSHLAWGQADGTVLLIDLAEVRKRLTQLNPAW